MQTSRYLYWGAQVAGWFVYSLLICLATYAEDPQKLNGLFLVLLLVFVLSGMAITHVMRWFFLQWGWLSLRLRPLLPRIVGISVLSATILSAFNYLISFLIDKEDEQFSWLLLIISILSWSVLMILWNAIYFTYHFFRKSINQEMYNLQLQASQHEIELKNLRSQLNPHFLFNSLNSIRALIDIEPKKAKSSVTTLSSLLRSSLVLGKNSFITLGEEMQIVKSYLELEKIRFEERLDIHWDLDNDLNEMLVPPFILQTQAENAIKHGVSQIVEGGSIIVRTVRKDPDTVLLSIENTGKLGKKTDTGIGIENTRRRLDLQYHGKANFELFESGKNVVCNIEIKIV